MQSTAPTLCESVLAAHSREWWKRNPGHCRSSSVSCCAGRPLERKSRRLCGSVKLVEKSVFFSYIWRKSSSKKLEMNDERRSRCLDEATARTGRTSGGFWFNTVKFMALLTFVTFQGSQLAIAGPNGPGGMQLFSSLGDLDDISTGFASAFLLIFFSELGDKTFFIAALLAARNSGAIVFIGTFGALGAMTLVSVLLGRTFHYVDGILPMKFGTDLPIDDIAAACLLIYFGVTTLIDASTDGSSKTAEEKKEAELAISEVSGSSAGLSAATNTVISTFLLVFVAEWGDKSFFSTIALAAAGSPLGVISGALAGHAVATTLAVVGGSLLGSFFSEKVISYIGGTLFLVFAAITLMEIIN